MAWHISLSGQVDPAHGDAEAIERVIADKARAFVEDLRRYLEEAKAPLTDEGDPFDDELHPAAFTGQHLNFVEL